MINICTLITLIHTHHNCSGQIYIENILFIFLWLNNLTLMWLHWEMDTLLTN